MIKSVQNGDCYIYHMHLTDPVELRPSQLHLQAASKGDLQTQYNTQLLTMACGFFLELTRELNEKRFVLYG